MGRPKHVRVMAGALEGDIFIGPKAEVRVPVYQGSPCVWVSAPWGCHSSQLRRVAVLVEGNVTTESGRAAKGSSLDFPVQGAACSKLMFVPFPWVVVLVVSAKHVLY